MKQIPLNYQPEKTYETFDDGTYKVTGFTYFSLNDKGNPILKAQSNGRLVAMLHFTLKDGKEGPAYFCELGEISLLVKAFGGDLSKLPKLPEVNQASKVTAYLSAAENLAKGETTIEVKKGFVRSIKGAEVPIGLYYVKVVDINPKTDGMPHTITGQFGDFFYVNYQIVAGEGGGDSPYNGVVFSEIMNYGLTLDEDGNPAWITSKTGGYTKNAVNMNKLITYTAPDFFENNIRFGDVNNILPEWLEQLQAADKVIKIMRIPNKNGKTVINFDTIEPVNMVEPKQSSFLTPKVNPKDTEEMNEKARNIFAKLFTELAGENPFTEGYSLSLKGKQTAKLYLSPLKDQKLLSHGTIGNLTFSEVEVIFKNIAIPDEHKDSFNKFNSELTVAALSLDSEEDFN